MIKIGLICGVLMARPGHPAKREIMRARGPVLLHPVRHFLYLNLKFHLDVMGGWGVREYGGMGV